MNLPGLDFQLGDDIDALRDAVRGFAASRDRAARGARSTASDQFPMDLWRKMGELGVLGITVAEEYGGADMGYLAHMVAMEEISRASRVGRPVLRRAQQPVREPDQAQRQRGAEAEVPAEADQRRTRRRAGDERAGRRLRRDLDEAQGRGARAATTVLNGTKMWITNGPDADTLVVYAKTEPRARRARRHRLHRREGHEGLLDRAEARQARHARQPHRRAGVRERRGAGRQRAGRAQRRRQGADERPRLRARGARRRADRHHAGGDGQRGAVHPRPQAVRPEHRRVPADPGQGGRHVHRAAGRARFCYTVGKNLDLLGASTCARCARTAPA